MNPAECKEIYDRLEDKEWDVNPTVSAIADFAASLLDNGEPYADATPYKNDKMIWLICTGNFYLEGQGVGHDSQERGVRSYRDILVRYLVRVD